MREDIKKKVKEILDNYPPLIQSLNKTALDEPKLDLNMSKLLRDILDEGIVLLKNDNDILPLDKNDEVAYFGINQIDHFYVGYGSGGDVIAHHLVSPLCALEARDDIKYNKNLAEKYKQYSKNNRPMKGVWGYWSTYYDEMPITKDEIIETKKTSKQAVIFIGRASGEGQDNTLEEDQYYLNKEEKQLINDVIDVYGNVNIVINTGNIIDFSYLISLGNKISSIILHWHSGMESGHGIIDILYGDVSPSGKLTDEVALEYNKYPSQSFGGFDQNIYNEDIYVGYRYFETFDKDSVLYPFGYGLSYTKFNIDSKYEIDNTKVKIYTAVKNIGSRAGKEVVQVYLSKPNGLLGNPKRELVGFKKTNILNPNDVQNLIIEFDIKDFAAYDDSGITGNISCFVLEAGEYQFYVGTDVREASYLGSININDLIIVEKLSEQMTPKNPFDRMKRIEENGQTKLIYEKTPKRTLNRKDDILNRLPKQIEEKPLNISFDEVIKNPNLLDSFICNLSIEDLCALCYGEGHMRVEYGIAGNAGMFGGVNESLRSKGVMPIITTDGPSGLRANYHATLFPSGTLIASTFNADLAYKLGDLFGKEIKNRTDMILAPGLNIHRNVLCGRNFEYFSEDPYLTGVFATNIIKGIQQNGTSACPKHFACNNQELNRNANDSIVSERALREIYLKGFEMVVKKANPWSIMTSYNKVNGVWSHYNNELVTNILRNEWNYKGLVITDWWMKQAPDPDFPLIKDNAYRVRGGIDVLMPGSITNRNFDVDTTLLDGYKSGGITLAEIQRCAKNVLLFIINLKNNQE